MISSVSSQVPKWQIISALFAIAAISISHTSAQAAQIQRRACHEMMSTVQLLRRHTHLEGDEALAQLSKIARGCYQVIATDQNSRRFAAQMCITYPRVRNKQAVVFKWKDQGGKVHTLQMLLNKASKIELTHWPESAEAPQIHYEAVLNESARRWHSSRQSEIHFRIAEDGSLAHMNARSQRHFGPFQSVWSFNARILFHTDPEG